MVQRGMAGLVKRAGQSLVVIVLITIIGAIAFYLGHNSAIHSGQIAVSAPTATSHLRATPLPSSSSPAPMPTRTTPPTLNEALSVYPSVNAFLLNSITTGGHPHLTRSTNGWIGSMVGGGGPIPDDEGATFVGGQRHIYDGLYALHYAVPGAMNVIYDVFVFPSPRAAREGRQWIDDNHLGSGVLAPPNPHPVARGEDLFAYRDTSHSDYPSVSPYTLLTYRNLIFSAEVTSSNRAYYAPGIKRIQAIDASLIAATNRYAVAHPHEIEPTPVASATPWPTPIPTATTQPYTPNGVHVCDDDHYSSKDGVCRSNASQVADLFMYHLAYTGKNGSSFAHATVRVVIVGRRQNRATIAPHSYADPAGTQYSGTGEGLQNAFDQAHLGLEENTQYTISVFDGSTSLGSITFTYTGLTTPYTLPATPTPKPTPVPVSPLHICTFSHFDQTNVQCLQDDSSLSLTDNTAVIVFPDATGISNDGTSTPIYVSAINVLRQDGTGRWVVVATQNMDVGVVDNFGGPGIHRIFETVNHLDFNATGVGSSLFTPSCNDQVEYQLLGSTGYPIATIPLTFTC